MNDMLPEVAAAIEIADRHLVGQSIERRKALALDISKAIMSHAGRIAIDAINKSFEKTRESFGKVQ